MLLEATVNPSINSQFSEFVNPYTPADELGQVENEETALDTRYGFQINSLGLLVEKYTTSEVIMNPLIYPIPLAAVWLKGLINLRGNLLPVFDLNSILDLNGNTSESNTTLVIGKGTDAVGICIDHLPVALKDTGQKGKTMQYPKWLYRYIKPAFTANDITWFEFNFKKFFLDIKNNKHTI